MSPSNLRLPHLNLPSLAQVSSRRGLLVAGSIAGVASALGLSAHPSQAQSNDDVALLNGAIALENQAIWAYGAAAGKLTDTPVGKTVLAVATRNLKDHEQHRAVLANAVKSLGGTPTAALDKYDLSTYIDAKEGNLDSDANIAKLALALEFDAALAYIDSFSKLKTTALIAAAGTIGPNEAAHATAIRAVFNSLDASVAVVPTGFVSKDDRGSWILKV